MQKVADKEDWRMDQRRKYLRNQLEQTDTYKQNLEAIYHRAEAAALFRSVSEAFIFAAPVFWSINIIADVAHDVVNLKVNEQFVGLCATVLGWAVGYKIFKQAFPRWSEKLHSKYEDAYEMYENSRIEKILRTEFNNSEKTENKQ